MEEESSTDFGLEKSGQLNDIKTAMVTEKHEQDIEHMRLKDEFDEQRHRREMKKASMEMEQIRQQQEEANRIREHEMQMATDNHNRKMDELRQQKEFKMMELEMVKLQCGDADRNREHLERMEGQKHEREKKMRAMQNAAHLESKKREEAMLKLQLDEADIARLYETEMEAKR